MTFVFVDYSKNCAGTAGEPAVPERLTGKFVQIRDPAAEYLVFSPTDVSRYHAQIVGRFCADRGLAGFEDQGRKRFDIIEPGWSVVGGGRFEIDILKRLVRLSDASMAYGRFDEDGLGEKLRSVPAFSGYTIEIV